MKYELPHIKNLENKVIILLGLSDEFKSNNLQKAKQFSEEALVIAKEIENVTLETRPTIISPLYY